MKHLRRSLLLISFAAGASFSCIAQSAEQTPIQEHALKIGALISQANQLIEANPREALTTFEEILQKEPPAFDSENFNTVSASYGLYANVARLYFEAARAADDGGYWEKSAEYHKKAAEVISDAAAKTKEALEKNIEYFGSATKHLQAIMDANADEINKLRAKDEKNYTNDDLLQKEKLTGWEKELKDSQETVDFYAKYIERVTKDAAWYTPTPSREEIMLDKIKQQRDQIENYIGGRGNTVKFVEGIVAGYVKYMENFSQGEKISFTYRLMVLSPDSKTAPVLLDVLRGKATKADLDRARKK
ncbi:MAG: hypothetical protein LBH03_05525 [Holophagales bacterium]|jgi:hypothetical protein|nr:hypothetical protein [Holophagales bacterium]